MASANEGETECKQRRAYGHSTADPDRLRGPPPGNPLASSFLSLYMTHRLRILEEIVELFHVKF